MKSIDELTAKQEDFLLELAREEMPTFMFIKEALELSDETN